MSTLYLAGLLALFTSSLNLVSWDHSENSVLDSNDGDAESWESVNLFTLKWFYDDDTSQYIGLYSGGDNYADNLYQIGLVTGDSLDNLDRALTSNPVMTESGSGYMQSGVMEPYPYRIDASTLGMYFAGQEPDGSVSIGHATSSTTGTTWTATASAVIDRGTSGTFDDYWAGKPALVVKDNGDHWVYYSALKSGGTKVSIGLAISTNSYTGPFVKQGEILSVDSTFLLYPFAQDMDDGTTRLYLQVGPNGGPYNARLYVSDDGETAWRDSGQIMVRGSSGTYRDWYIGGVCIRETSKGLEMTYHARKKSEIGASKYHAVGYALGRSYKGGGSEQL